MPQVSIGAELQALPLAFLISAPLTAAIEAQALAAQTTADFLTKVTLAEDAITGDLEAVMVKFGYTSQVPDPQTPGQVVPKDFTLSVPLMAITQLPYLRINDLSVDFEFKIRDVQSVATRLKLANEVSTGVTSKSTVDTSIRGGFGRFLSFGGTAKTETEVKFNATASATYQRAERHDTDRSATYKLSVNAVQDPIPEGMRRVLEIMANAVSNFATV